MLSSKYTKKTSKTLSIVIMDYDFLKSFLNFSYRYIWS